MKPAAETRIRVRYAETDQMGVVYYANYLIWMEVGRVEFCKSCGFNYRDMEREDGVLLAVAEATCRYRYLGDLMHYWNPDWKLLRAGVGGAGGGMRGLRGNTYLDGDVLATYPRDEVRGLVLTRKTTLSAAPKLSVEVGADEGRAWALDVHVDNERVLTRTIQAKGPDRGWDTVEVNLQTFAGKSVTLRLIQRVLLGPQYASGNAYWRNLTLK